MIAQYFTLFEKMRGTLPFLVFNSLERKDDPCKSDSQHFTLFETLRDTLPVIVFNSLERKDDRCKSDNQHFTVFEKNATLYPFKCIIY